MQRSCKEAIRSVRALILQWKMQMVEPPSIIEAIQSVINHSPLERMGQRNDDSSDKIWRSPMKVFKRIKPSLLIICPSPLVQYKDFKGLRVSQLSKVKTFHKALHDMHMEV